MPNDTPARAQCVERVWNKERSGWRREKHQCPRASVVKRDGQAFCKQHDPEQVKAGYEARQAASMAQLRREQALRTRDRAFVAACEQYVAGGHGRVYHLAVAVDAAQADYEKATQP